MANENSVKISIVVPIYNVENDIENCLKCLQKQSLKDIEIICVDDVSTDNSLKIVEEYAKNDDRIIIVRHKENLSANVSRREGALLAKGEYILFIDPDDTIEKDCLKPLYKTAKETNVDILHFGTNVINCGVTDKQVEWYENFSRPYYGYIYGEEVFTRCFLTQDYRFNIWNKLIKAHVCKRAMTDCVNIPLPKAQDLYAYFLIAYYAGSYLGIEDKYYNYAFGGGVSGGRTFTEEKFRRHCSQSDVAYYIIDFLIKNKCLDKYYDAAFRIINNLINDNIASLKACGKAKVNFSAEDILYESWLNGKLQNSLLSYIKKSKDAVCAKLLFEIEFKLFKNLSLKTRRKILMLFLSVYDCVPEVLTALISESDVNDKDYMFLQTVQSAINARWYNERYIPVVMATNNNYAAYLGVTLNSIIKNSDDYYFYDIYVFHSGINKYYIEKLNSVKKDNVAVHCVNVKQIISSQNLYSNRHYSVEMYHRFLIPELFFFLPKVLYLDCDIVVLDSIHKLFRIDIGNNTLGAARNLLHSEMYDYVTQTLHHDPEIYFNSGVLLINCDQFITENIKNKCYDFLKKNTELQCPDQDALNKCCKNVMILDTKWNFQWHHYLNKDIAAARYKLISKDAELFDNALNDVRLIHYTSNKKPWNYLCSEYSDIFWEYVNGSVFEREVVYRYSDIDDPLKKEIKKLNDKIKALQEELDAIPVKGKKKKKNKKKKGVFKGLVDCLRENGVKYTFKRIMLGKKKTQDYYENINR
ncbi:MAG: glycosyltransferase [Clostridia bacterium]|nr:glycosyltransferase [Clostridia bacterium]